MRLYVFYTVTGSSLFLSLCTKYNQEDCCRYQTRLCHAALLSLGIASPHVSLAPELIHFQRRGSCPSPCHKLQIPNKKISGFLPNLLSACNFKEMSRGGKLAPEVNRSVRSHHNQVLDSADLLYSLYGQKLNSPTCIVPCSSRI